MSWIRVLLVDDEPLILRGLRKLVNWQDFGMTIVGEAYDAEEMWRLLEQSAPDLIVCDIQMPGASGIDIIRRLYESNRPVKTLFISAYRDFTYAQEALRYGAVEYLVKPIDKNGLTEALHKVVRLLDEHSARQRDKEKAERFESKERKETIEELFERLTHGDTGAAAPLLELGVISRSRYLSVCFGELDLRTASGSRWRSQERKLVDFAVANVLSEAMLPSGAGYCFRRGHLHGLIFQHDKPEEVLLRAQDLHWKIRHYLKLPFTIGVGLPVNELLEAETSANSALEALEASYTAGLNRVIDAREIVRSKGRHEELEFGIDQVLKELWRERGADPKQAREAVDRLLEAARRMSSGTKQGAVSLLFGLMERFYRGLEDAGMSEGWSEASRRDILDRMNECHSFDSLATYVSGLMEEALHQQGRKCGTEPRQQQIIGYIEEHYRENLTLETMAAQFYMNAYYFSSFFKKRFGENFKVYLTKVRMKHALRLIQGSDLLIYEVAQEVGYSNARQFSRMFKKHIGRFPQEYRSGAEAEERPEEVCDEDADDR